MQNSPRIPAIPYGPAGEYNFLERLLPKTMKAMQLTHMGPVETAPLELAEIAPPVPGAGQVLLRVRACGVCHTDLHIAEGELPPTKIPRILGHQVVGEVAAVGSSVDDWTPGERAGLPWLYSACGRCEACLRGDENLCPYARFTGLHVDGGYAQAVVAEAAYTLKLPAAIGDLQAAPLLCAGIIGYRSLRVAGVQPGERLGLVGFGASAHLAIQVAKHWGCRVAVFTRSPAHRSHAAGLGADWTGGIEDSAPWPLDRAVIFAPAGSLVPPMLEKLRPGGVLAINAVTMSELPALPYALLYGERSLRSVANATYRDGVEFLRLAAGIPIVSTVQEYPLEDANRALLDLKNSRINGEAVLLVD